MPSSALARERSGESKEATRNLEEQEYCGKASPRATRATQRSNWQSSETTKAELDRKQTESLMIVTTNCLYSVKPLLIITMKKNCLDRRSQIQSRTALTRANQTMIKWTNQCATLHIDFLPKRANLTKKLHEYRHYDYFDITNY